MGTTLFDMAAENIERGTSMNRFEARGTLRIALKEVGLDAATLTIEQFAVVALKVLPGELKIRGIEGAEQICRALIEKAKAAPEATTASIDAADVFDRIGSR